MEHLAFLLLVIALAVAVIAIFTMVSSAPASAFPLTSHPVGPLECHVRSVLAEADGDPVRAIGWAESLAARDPGSSFALSRAARLHEAVGEDSAALDCGERALALDSLDAEGAMLVGRLMFLAGRPDLTARVLTPPVRRSGGAMPELFALRALAHEMDRDYGAALADLERTGPLLADFGWIAGGVLRLALEDGRLEEAYHAFELANSLDPSDSQTLTLGLSLAKRIRNPRLERTLERALRASELP